MCNGERYCEGFREVLPMFEKKNKAMYVGEISFNLRPIPSGAWDIYTEYRDLIVPSVRSIVIGDRRYFDMLKVWERACVRMFRREVGHFVVPSRGSYKAFQLGEIGRASMNRRLD